MAEMTKSEKLNYNVIESSRGIVYEYKRKSAAEPDMQKATRDSK